MIELKKYQEKGINKLKTEIDDLLDYDNKICVFKSPTGSGKTIMMAEFLKRFVDKRQDNKDFAFIWIAVNKLHDQSKNKLEKYYEDNQILHCLSFEDLIDKKIGQNEILFFNWQSINKKDNVYIRENEKDNNLDKIIENTKLEGREIILVIDESHHTAKSEKSREIISTIAPKVTIEVSATPELQGNRIVEVDFNDVKEDGMIKSEVSINPEINEEKASHKTTDEVVIEQALEKRKDLINSYSKEGSNVNPLILIQLPDNKKGMIDRKDDVIKLLKDRDITVENGRLAIYLSDKDNKVNLANIEKNDNEVEVLIFKQAIALGWDCPRASILILFRDWQSITFSIQTIGRIMRMPEFKHYESEDLNKGYVFTNLSKVEIAQDIAKDYITMYESKRDNTLYKNLELESIYLKRQREKTRLSGQFVKLLLKIAENENIHRKINMKSTSKMMNVILTDGVIERIDEDNEVEGGKEVQTKISNRELQYRFDNLIIGLCHPFAPSDSSGRLKTSLYKFFNKRLKIESYTEIQKAILNKNNIQTIIDLVNSAKELYKETIIEPIVEQREIIKSIWEVPKIITHTTNFREFNYKKSIMKPFYDTTDSSLENDFIRYLEEHQKVKWWYKNGEVEPKYFAIEYKDTKGINRSFYPDFIVQMNDGQIGILETKGTLTASVTKEKAEALQQYIKSNKKKKLFGGIVYMKDNSWRLNDNAEYFFDENNLNDWKYLDKEL